MLPTKFGVNMPFGSWGEAKNRFSSWQPGGHLGFPTKMILAILIYSSIQCFLSRQSAFCFRRRSKKMTFRISYRNNLIYFFYLEVTMMLPTKFHVNWPFVSEEKKNSFQMGGHYSHLGFRIGKSFSYFCSTRHPDASYQVSSQLALHYEKKEKIDFQDDSHRGHLAFPIITIFTIFDLQVSLMLPTKIQVNWPFSSKERSKK